MSAPVERGAEALVRVQAARLDGFTARLDDLEPEDRAAALDDARAAMSAALTDPDDPDWLKRLLWQAEWDNAGRTPPGPIEDAPDFVTARYGALADAIRAAILGGAE